MTHDPLCEKGWGYPDFIVSRGIKRKDCWMCDLLRQAEQRGHDEAMDMDPVRRRDAYLHGERDMLAKCIAEVERIHSPMRIDDDLSYCRGCADAAYEEYSYAWPCAVVTSVRALQQPTGPIEDLTDEEADAFYDALQEKP